MLYYTVGQKFARNRSISYHFKDIFNVNFPQKSKMAAYVLQFSKYSHFFIFRKNPRWPPKVAKIEFSPFALDTLVLPCGSKICSKSLYLVRFSRYSHFFIFCKNPRWPPKVAKIEISPLCKGHSCTTLWVKNSLEITLSLMVCEIFVIFQIFIKSSNKVAITHLYIEQQL